MHLPLQNDLKLLELFIYQIKLRLIAEYSKARKLKLVQAFIYEKTFKRILKWEQIQDVTYL